MKYKVEFKPKAYKQLKGFQSTLCPNLNLDNISWIVGLGENKEN